MSYKTDHFDDKVVELLAAGGVGLVPADTIYGLSCAALDEAAVIRLRRLKGRNEQKPFIVLISRVSQLDKLGLSGQAGPALKYWPGRLTIILEAKDIPDWLQMGTRTLAVRRPGDEGLLKLVEKTGPLISTSANLSGGEPAQTAEEAQKYFGNNLDFYVDQGRLTGQPSTIVKLVSDKLIIVRQGVVKIKKEDLA